MKRNNLIMLTFLVLVILMVTCGIMDKSKAAGNSIEGYMIFYWHSDTTTTFYRNATTTEEFFGNIMALKLAGVDCDSMFFYYWMITFAGDTSDFNDDPEPYNVMTYYPPNEMGGCDDIKLYGAAPAKNTQTGGTMSHSGYIIFVAKEDSTVEYYRTTTTAAEMNWALTQLKSDGVPCDSVLWWYWQVSFADTLLEDESPPYPGADDTFTPLTESRVDDCDSLILTDPF